MASVSTYAQAGGNTPGSSGGKSTSKATSVATSKRPSPAGRPNELTIGNKPAASSATGQNTSQHGARTAGQASAKQVAKTVKQQAAGVRQPSSTSNSGNTRKPVHK